LSLVGIRSSATNNPEVVRLAEEDCRANSPDRLGLHRSDAFGAAGLLDGRRRRTHWNWCEVLIRRAPRAEVDPDPILSGTKTFTHRGVTAGMDLAWHWSRRLRLTLALQVARNLVCTCAAWWTIAFSAALSWQVAIDTIARTRGWVLDNLNKP